jgi:hypothetical protein
MEYLTSKPDNLSFLDFKKLINKEKNSIKIMAMNLKDICILNI